MSEHRKPPRHGSHSRYNNYGCRCEPCRRARQDYLRAYVTRRDARAVEAAGRDPGAPGPVELAVAAELDGYAGERVGLVAVAMVLAADLDRPACARSHAAICKQLRATLDVLESAPRRPRGKLRSVTALAERRGSPA